MPEAISNTSPLLYLYRISGIDWLPQLFTGIWTTPQVVRELENGQLRGYAVPDPAQYPWLQISGAGAPPSEWLALDLGSGELSVMALALENPTRVVLLDDGLARRIAQAAGLTVWGTLRVLLEAKSIGLIAQVKPYLTLLRQNGMWMSEDIRTRILKLAGE